MQRRPSCERIANAGRCCTACAVVQRVPPLLRRGTRKREEAFHVEHFGVDNGVKRWYHRGAPTGGAPAPSDRGAASAAPLFLFVSGLPVPA